MRADVDKDEGGLMVVARAGSRGSRLELIARADADKDTGGSMVVSWASDRGLWLVAWMLILYPGLVR